MEIRLSSVTALIACNNYLRDRKTDEELMDDLDNHDGWSIDIIGPVFENDSFFNKLKRMAEEVKNSKYPFVIVNDKEWELIEINLKRWSRL